ncbi:protein of unknown function [Halogeometricum limi]|uniref:DUF4352 domain-containing protein n=2 Tax=Halogeometricum limi TaxID=555875 RepID=A0A1I6I5K5_9EURY|nr:protein of unknown function [Halogeometricum limi]
MKGGSTIRNVLVGIVYVFLLPLLFALLPVTVGLIVGMNVGGAAGKLSVLPGVGDGGGAIAGVAAGVYAVLILGVLGAVVPSDDTAEAPEQNVEGATGEAATAADGGNQGATAEESSTAAPEPTVTATPKSTPEPTAEPTPEPTPTATTQPEMPMHDVGESFTVGDGEMSIEYTVTDVTTADNVGGEYGEDADGEFVIVTMSMENVGDESLDITSRPFTVVDSEGREFEVDTNAMVYAEDSIVFEQLNPGLSKEGVVIFDVNPDGEYTMHIAPAGMFSTATTHRVAISGEIQ